LLGIFSERHESWALCMVGTSNLGS
jgi:hypothetical protein